MICITVLPQSSYQPKKIKNHLDVNVLIDRELFGHYMAYNSNAAGEKIGAVRLQWSKSAHLD